MKRYILPLLLVFICLGCDKLSLTYLSCKTDYVSFYEGAVFDNVNEDDSSLVFVFYPNIFTPNGDGINDVFRARGSFFDRIENYSITVKKGRKIVFKSDDINAYWDGRESDGNDAIEGNYKFAVSFNIEGSNDLVELEGKMALVRFLDGQNSSVNDCVNCTFEDQFEFPAGIIPESYEVLNCNQ